jgi:hypothetical protein
MKDFSVRVMDMHSKRRKNMERVLTGANVNGTGEIKQQVNTNLSCDL